MRKLTSYPLYQCNIPRTDAASNRRQHMAVLCRGVMTDLDSVREGERWLLALQDSMRFAAALITLWQKGALPVISTDLQPGTVALLECDLDGILCDEELSTSLRQIRLSERVAADGEPVAPVFDGEKTAIRMFTSGTTGERKAIDKSFRSLFEEIAALDRSFGTRVRGVIRFSTVSHFHIYGLLFNVLWPLWADDEMVRQRMFYWEEILNGIDGSEACVVSSPAHLRFLPDIAFSGFRDSGSLTVFSSGAPLAAEVVHRMEDAGLPAPFEVFGSTETGGVGVRRQTRGQDARFTPLAGVEVRCDIQHRLQVRSPWLPDPAEWMETGDTARISDGRFELTGRFDRIVKIAGKRVSLSEMERLLQADERVVATRVFQLSADSDRERSALAAVVQLSPMHMPLPQTREGRQQLIAALRTRLLTCVEPVVIPRRWRFVDALPVDSQGKTTLFLLRGLADRGNP